MASSLEIDEYRFCIIVGAGIAGILQGCDFIRKNVLPLDKFQIIERYGGYGGVWYKNTYPGVACDVPSHIYSVSWAPNPNWSRKYAPGAEIQNYYDTIAKQHRLDKVTTFNTEVETASWDEKELLWMVETRNIETGRKKRWGCNLLISAPGEFSVPKKAPIPGLETFKGEMWHTVSWPKDADLKGKRVGIIGTGSSAAQLIPKIYPDVASMTVYQRSPSHCVPRNDFEFSSFTKTIFSKFNWVMKIYRSFLWKFQEFMTFRVYKKGTWAQSLVVKLSRNHLYSQIKDANLREKLTSYNNFGCKRALVLDDYYPTLAHENVELVTDPITSITELGVISRCKDTDIESERCVDVLIWGTGYTPDKVGGAYLVKGRNGQLLSTKYNPDNYSLYGIAVDNFPNFLNFLGPNSLSLWSSVVRVIELQANYNCQVATYLLDRSKGSCRYAIMPREDVVKQWTESLRDEQQKHPAAVPSCHSYYKSPTGQVSTYPFENSRYRKLVAKPNFQRDWVLMSNRVGESQVEISTRE